MQGFFQESTLIDKRRVGDSLLPRCGACKLYKQCQSPKMPVYGRGERRIMIVGEAPGEKEDETGIPFIGKAGQFLRKTLSDLGVDLKRDCWTTNAVICRPPNNKLPNKAVEYCRPNLIRTVQQYEPHVVILLGSSAVDSLITWLWKDDVGQMQRWVGWQIPSQQINAWVCPAYHPSFLLRQNDAMMNWKFTEHVRGAVERAKSGRPWKKLPEYSTRVILDDAEAANEIRSVTKLNLPAAADYETNSLKPEYAGSKILCCSLSVLGTRSAFGFLWRHKAIEAMREFWRSGVPKVASNLKFESRWTKWYFGLFPKNWYADTMLLAHFLDCRPGITSIKFQSFVQLGVGSYNDHIEPLLRASRGSVINQAELEIDTRQLLTYCAEDSLYEGETARKQLKQLR